MEEVDPRTKENLETLGGMGVSLPETKEWVPAGFDRPLNHTPPLATS